MKPLRLSGGPPISHAVASVFTSKGWSTLQSEVVHGNRIWIDLYDSLGYQPDSFAHYIGLVTVRFWMYRVEAHFRFKDLKSASKFAHRKSGAGLKREVYHFELPVHGSAQLFRVECYR